MIVEINEYSAQNHIDNFNNFLKNNIYTLEFKKKIEEIYKIKVYFFLFYDSKNIPSGSFCFYVNHNIGYGFVNSCFIKSSEHKKKILDFLNEFIKKKKLKKINFFSFAENEIDLGCHEVGIKYLFIRKFTEKNIDEVWEKQPSVFRTEVRKCLKRGFELKKIKNPTNLYKYYLFNCLQKKIPIHKKEFLDSICKLENANLLTVTKNNLEVGYLLLINSDLIFANYNKHFNGNGIMQLLYWEAIKLCFKNNNYLNMGFSDPLSNTAFFKKKCGAEQILIKELELYNSNIAIPNKSDNEKKQSILKKYLSKLLNKIYNFLPVFIKIYLLKKIKLQRRLF